MHSSPYTSNGAARLDSLPAKKSSTASRPSHSRVFIHMLDVAVWGQSGSCRQISHPCASCSLIPLLPLSSVVGNCEAIAPNASSRDEHLALKIVLPIIAAIVVITLIVIAVICVKKGYNQSQQPVTSSKFMTSCSSVSTLRIHTVLHTRTETMSNSQPG